jgi:hypothetical protein
LGLITIKPDHMRDDAVIEPFYCRIEPVELGFNDEGARISSGIIRHEQGMENQNRTNKRTKLSDKQRRFLAIFDDAMCNIPDQHRRIMNTEPGSPIAITREWLKIMCISKGWFAEGITPHAQRSRLSEMVNGLAGRQLVGCNKDYVWRL